MDQQQNAPAVRENDLRHATWIAGRVETLLSHYFQPDNPAEVMEAAVDDWVSALARFSRADIEAACSRYLRQEPRRRPTPGSVAAMVETKTGLTEVGDKAKLTFDERELLETKVLPTVRRWLKIPGLAEHGAKTLHYWGESV